jgi:hypothetical protein
MGREGEVEEKYAGGRRRSKKGGRLTFICAAGRFGCGGLQARLDVGLRKEKVPLRSISRDVEARGSSFGRDLAKR